MSRDPWKPKVFALSTWRVFVRAWKKSRWGVVSNMSPAAADELEAGNWGSMGTP